MGMGTSNPIDKPQRGRPFEKGKSGNSAGRPRGARNQTTVAAEALLDGEAEALTRKAIELALGGDMAALRLCLDRILPPRRDRPIFVELPALKETHNAAEAVSAIFTAVGVGQITLGEAAELIKLVDMFFTVSHVMDKDMVEIVKSMREDDERRERRDSHPRVRFL
jgi:hypothetical protein